MVYLYVSFFPYSWPWGLWLYEYLMTFLKKKLTSTLWQPSAERQRGLPKRGCTQQSAAQPEAPAALWKAICGFPSLHFSLGY